MTYTKPLEIVLFGDPGTGKSNLLSRFTNNYFNPNYEPTHGIDVDNHTILVGDQRVELEILDLVGHEKWRRVADKFLRDADGILLVYDISNPATFQNLVACFRHIDQAASPKTVIKLVGNKSDLQDRAVPIKEAEQFAIDNGLSYIETSALNNSNVHLAFESIAQEIAVATQSVSEPRISSTASFVQKASNASSGHDNDQQDKPFQIVLIDIEQAARNSDIVCVEKPLDEANLKFIAISYRWGEIAEHVIDTKVGYMASITSFDVMDFYDLCQDMRQEADLQSIKYVWVDAICVDQNNHAHRKATIYQMSNIYHRAAYILAVPDLHLAYLSLSDLYDYRLRHNRNLHDFVYYLLHGKVDKLDQVTEKWFDEMGIPKSKLARKKLTAPRRGLFINHIRRYHLKYSANSRYDSSAHSNDDTQITLVDCVQRAINWCHDHFNNTTMVYENSDCALCSHQMDMSKEQIKRLSKNEVSPDYDQKWLACVLRELDYDKYRELVREQSEALSNFMDYLENLIKDWSSRVWVISEYNIAKTKQSRKMKFWFLSLRNISKLPGKLDFFVFDFDKTGTHAVFSESDFPCDNGIRGALGMHRRFQNTMMSHLNAKSFFKMMLDSKASRNEDRFYAIFPSTEYKNMITSREVVSSWKIDNIVSVKLKLYELMTTKDKLELLYLTSFSKYKSMSNFPAFAHANVVEWEVTPVKGQNEDGRPCNFDLNNNEALRLVPPDMSLEDENENRFYKLRLSPKMYYALTDETDDVMELFDHIISRNKILLETLEVDYADDDLFFVLIPIYMANIDRQDLGEYIEHIPLFGSFNESKWLLCDELDSYSETDRMDNSYSWVRYDNSNGNTSFDIY